MNEAIPTTHAPAAAQQAHEGIKETIESIVVALILAFVFRAFIVEAFVIPTGSMAPTLYGAHGTILCEDCGVEFAYGLRDLDDQRQGQPVRAHSEAVCPNCQHPNTNLAINDERMNPERGDRILVLKWPFDLDGERFGPARWDVVVFKDPSDGVTNFIKRLVGMPEEVLMILDGDVYRAPLSELSETARAELMDYIDRKYEFISGQRQRGALQPVNSAVLAELEGKLDIVRKTAEAQEALWLLVYDHDYPPRSADPYQPRWRAVQGERSGWDASGRRVRFQDRNRGRDYIELHGASFRADNAYNILDGADPPPVSDLRVEFVWTPAEASATVQVRLEKLGRAFWATVSADGTVMLHEARDAPSTADPAMAVKTLPPFTPGRAVAIRFQCVDYRLGIHIHGEPVIESSSEHDSAAFFGPDVEALRAQERRRSSVRPDGTPPRLYGSGGDFAITHLLVERDVHYYHHERLASSHQRQWIPPEGWGGPESPILLREGEYFMLGDNTAASKDSRLWDERGEHLISRGPAFQLGTVPRDQLIGKAFFVYWPSGHRLEWLPIPWLRRVGIVPDVGRMRWIH